MNALKWLLVACITALTVFSVVETIKEMDTLSVDTE